MPTREEIDELKRQWTNDPCWEIEETEGFEEHFDELWQFHQEWAQQKRDEQARYLQQRAVELGVVDNPTLLATLLKMEQQIDRLTAKVEEQANTIAAFKHFNEQVDANIRKIWYQIDRP